MIRQPAVAGQFYPYSKSSLLESIESCFLDKTYGPEKLPASQDLNQRTIIGGISPHAGYMYSGSAAAHTYFNLFKEKTPDTVIIFGTDHVGYGRIALMKEGAWETPLGKINIDTDVSNAILKQSSVILDDSSAFLRSPFSHEHNIEVQLPFIQYCAGNKEVQFIPIKVSTHDFNKLEQMAKGIAEAVKNLDKDIVFVASSDMTHKEIRNSGPDLEKFKQLDKAVMDAFLELDPEKTFKMARKTTVCGAQTITSLILTTKLLGGTKAEVLKYYTSHDKTGSLGYCVGYFSGIILK